MSRKLQDKFTKRSKASNYSTRNNNDLHLPKPRLEFTRKASNSQEPSHGMKSHNNIETTPL